MLGFKPFYLCPEKSNPLAQFMKHVLTIPVFLFFRQFCRLPKNDQRLLLARNSSLYIQLYMGCFFGAASGGQQKELIRKYQVENQVKML